MENIYVKSHWHASKRNKRDGEINFDDVIFKAWMLEMENVR
jgi:hypothetical protein